MSIEIVPVFIILYTLFRVLNNNAHKVYLEQQDKEIENKIEKERKNGNKEEMISNIITLITTGISLFLIGEQLGSTLENLCRIFNISEIIVGILLGLITSIPELITFFESQKYHKEKSDGMVGVVEATNNLLTSNIINLFIIQTIGILIMWVK